MKIVLDEKWEYSSTLSRSSHASWKHICLRCQYNQIYTWDDNGNRNEDKWIGIAILCSGHKRSGPYRQSVKEARRDAERLAIELLRDIRDGTKKLMETYDICEDD